MPDSTLPTAVQPRQHALLRVQPGKRRPLLQRLTWERLKTIALTLIFGYPAAVLIRLVSPLVRIRVGEIPVNRIGYILPTADLYLCEKTEWRGRRPLDLVYFSGPSVNSAAYEMVRRKIRPVPWARFIAGPNARLPGAENHVIEFRYFGSTGHSDREQGSGAPGQYPSGNELGLSRLSQHRYREDAAHGGIFRRQGLCRYPHGRKCRRFI